MKKKETMVYPTHTCFDDAMNMLNEFAKYRPSALEDLSVVHARCTAPDGQAYAHAWLEDRSRNVVMFDGMVKGKRHHLEGDKEEYYANVGVRDVVRYTVRQAFEEHRKHGMCGPWVPHLVALCSKNRKVWLPR